VGINSAFGDSFQQSQLLLFVSLYSNCLLQHIQQLRLDEAPFGGLGKSNLVLRLLIQKLAGHLVDGATLNGRIEADVVAGRLILDAFIEK
jgi:hypothetical protein